MSDEYEALLQALLGTFGPRLKAIVLFGSRARGDARPESDHDIFIVAEDLPADPLTRQREVRGALMDCLADLPGAMSLRAKTPSEFSEDLAPLYLDVCVDGVCLYGSAYFEPFRQRALAALAASGLKRERIGQSLYWMFPQGSARKWELTWDGYRELP